MSKYFNEEKSPEKIKSNPEEWLYCSARVRAIAASEDGELLNRVIEAKTADDAIRMLHRAELGDDVADFSDYEQIFSSELEEAYAAVLEMIPETGAVDFLRLKYDCNNVKTAIKGNFRGSNLEDMLSAIGTVPVDDVIDAAKSGDFSCLPVNMAKAAAEASEAYSKTGDPQQIDFLLDSACSLDTAESTTDEFSETFVRMKIDLTNLLICQRLIRMNNPELCPGMLQRAYLPGGKIELSRLNEIYESGESGFWEFLSSSEYSPIGTVLPGRDSTPAEIERAVDNFIADYVKTSMFVPFGLPVAAAFLIDRETEIKNLRIAVAGKLAGLSNDVIRARMRAI